MRLINAYAVRCDRDDFDTYADYIKAFDAINEAPTVECIPKWIPVSERLPVADGSYIVTVTDKCGVWSSVADYYHDQPHQWVAIGHVIAWMPFPMPYEVEE